MKRKQIREEKGIQLEWHKKVCIWLNHISGLNAFVYVVSQRNK